jgi:hypothetical protein
MPTTALRKCNYGHIVAAQSLTARTASEAHAVSPDRPLDESPDCDSLPLARKSGAMDERENATTVWTVSGNPKYQSGYHSVWSGVTMRGYIAVHDKEERLFTDARFSS